MRAAVRVFLVTERNDFEMTENNFVISVRISETIEAKEHCYAKF